MTMVVGGASCTGLCGAPTLKSGRRHLHSPGDGQPHSEPQCQAPTHPLTTHRVQLEEGFRGPLRDIEQHMDVGWEGDQGLLVVECDCGSFLHPQGQQEVLVQGQLPQGLEKCRGRT